MTQRERILFLALPVVVLVAGFWFLVLAPKRHEASRLGTQVTELRRSVAKAEQEAAAADQAKNGYRDYYSALIGLGKAVPQDDDTSSLLVALGRLARRAHVDFRSIDLKASATPAPPASPAPQDKPAEGGAKKDEKAPADGQPAGSVPAGAPAAGSAAPTETAAATLPLGAAVGPAGFPVMPYELSFRGSFFRIADFIRGVDRLVSTSAGRVAVRGRLLTIDGFSLKPPAKGGFPALDATFAVTTYLTPPEQGLSLGGTPSAPASGAAQPVSATEARP